MSRHQTIVPRRSSIAQAARRLRILPALAAIAMCSSAADADTLYRCTDALGAVLYTNQSSDRKSCTPLGIYPDAPRAEQEPQRSEPKVRPACTGANCSIKISKNKDGHFYVDGAINGTKVHFLIDTGSSSVVLNQSTAAEANVYGSKSVLLRTAGGTVSGSVATDVPLSIANLPPINTEVAISPSLEEPTSLLGQSYLKMFKVTIEGSTMELSR